MGTLTSLTTNRSRSRSTGEAVFFRKLENSWILVDASRRGSRVPSRPAFMRPRNEALQGAHHEAQKSTMATLPWIEGAD